MFIALERDQNSTRFMADCKGGHYESLLRNLTTPTLERFQRMGEIKLTNFGINSILPSEECTWSESGAKRRGRRCKA